MVGRGGRVAKNGKSGEAKSLFIGFTDFNALRLVDFCLKNFPPHSIP